MPHSFSSFSASFLSLSSSQLLTCIPRPTFTRTESKNSGNIVAVIRGRVYSYNSLDSWPGSEKLVLRWGFFLVGRTWHFSVHCLTSPILLPSSPVRQSEKLALSSFPLWLPQPEFQCPGQFIMTAFWLMKEASDLTNTLLEDYDFTSLFLRFSKIKIVFST